MIAQLTVDSFKSIQNAKLDFGQVNVFIGANGSGKSNLLEAIAVLSAAAGGKVDLPALLWRGCRPSGYFRPMFADSSAENRVLLKATGDRAFYEVSLAAPPPSRRHAWRYLSERWGETEASVVATPSTRDPYAGIAALTLAVTPPENPEAKFLKALAAFSIYSAAPPILHGWAQDPQEREPIGLGGGRLAEAIQELVSLKDRQGDALAEEFAASLEWFGGFFAIEMSDPQSRTKDLAFVDRHFRREGNHSFLLSPDDVNEGALYLAFLAVLGLHPEAPTIFAVENVDHGLNPLLAKRLMATLTSRILASERKRQVFLTTHNPLVLDGLPLGDERVRLFTVDRDNEGRTIIQRFLVTEKHREMAAQGWTLSRMWVNKLIGGVPDV